MAVIETWLRQDLKGLVTVRSLQGQVFSLDNGGNLIGVKVTKDYKPVTLTGTVTGYCILSDGQTVTVTGSGNAGIQNGNEAYIVLPQLVYSVPGQISIVIKLTSGNTTTTLAACTGYVYRSRTSNEVVPPGTPIPDLATMEEVIRRATEATDAANAATVGAEKVDASMTKEGDVITITVTDRDGNVTEKTVTDQTEAMKRKADIDGYYEELAAGTADQLVSTEAVTDTTPYLYRKSGGSVDVGNRETLEKIVGGTVNWNQLAKGKNHLQNGIQTTFTDGIYELSGESTNSYAANIESIILYQDHKYLQLVTVLSNPNSIAFNVGSLNSIINPVGPKIGLMASIANANQGRSITAGIQHVQTGLDLTGIKYKYMLIDLTAMFGPTIADYIYGLEQATPGAGVAWFRKLFPKDYYSYNPGELISVKPSSHDMVGFNAWDEEWRIGTYVIETGAYAGTPNRICNKNPISVIPDTVYYKYVASDNTGSGVHDVIFYDADMNYIGYAPRSKIGFFTTPSNCHYINFHCWASYGATYKNDICFNLSHSGARNGEYEPYEKHSYPLADVELRGPLAIDADGKLVYSGDEYTPDGQVKRKYGIVDLGTLPWTLGSGASGVNRFYSTSLSNSIKKPASNMDMVNAVCAKYMTVSENSGYTGTLGFSTNPNGVIAVYGETNYETAAAFKTAMTGVMLVYELATPTAEQAAPYTPIQVVDDWGTEEFVDTREVAIPVGHSTSYMANLRDKLQHLPSLADEDGEYIVKQTGTKMELTKLSSSGLAQGIFVETESAPVVSFADGADGQAMKSVKVAIEPVQDLHGYDYPWPAGGGKNLLKVTASTNTVNGVTFTVNEDGIISCSGNATDTVIFNVCRWTGTSGTEYILNGCPSGGSGSRYKLDHNNNPYVIDNGSGILFTANGNEGLVRIVIYVGYGDGLVFKPMIRLATEADSTFAPYSNICPISGWTGAKVTRTGKNLFNKNLSRTVNKLRDDNGVQQTTSSSSYTEDFGGVEPGTTYTLSGSISKNTGSGRIYFLDQYHNWISRSNGITQERMPYTVTTPANCKYLAVQYLNSASDLDDLQLEIGSVATEYEPFGQTYEVTFPADPGTVYGGTLDVATGLLTVDRVYRTFNGSESWAVELLSKPLRTYYYITLGALGYVVDESIVCDKYRQVSITSQNEDIGINVLNSSARARATLTLRPNHNGMPVDEFKAWLAENPITCAYKITSATVYQLTPTEIKTLLGENRIFADAGNVAVTYPADTKTYIDNRINSTRKLIAGIETGFVASKAYAVGDMLIIGDDLYKVASSIASGATITVGTNVTKTTVAEQLISLMNA